MQNNILSLSSLIEGEAIGLQKDLVCSGQARHPDKSTQPASIRRHTKLP